MKISFLPNLVCICTGSTKSSEVKVIVGVIVAIDRTFLIDFGSRDFVIGVEAVVVVGEEVLVGFEVVENRFVAAVVIVVIVVGEVILINSKVNQSSTVVAITLEATLTNPKAFIIPTIAVTRN